MSCTAFKRIYSSEVVFYFPKNLFGWHIQQLLSPLNQGHPFHWDTLCNNFPIIRSSTSPKLHGDTWCSYKQSFCMIIFHPVMHPIVEIRKSFILVTHLRMHRSPSEPTIHMSTPVETPVEFFLLLNFIPPISNPIAQYWYCKYIFFKWFSKGKSRIFI